MVGARGPECRIDETNGSTRWYVYDGLGSVLTEVDDKGEVTTGWTDNQNQFHPTLRKYDAFGAERNNLPQNGTSDHKFVGNLGHSSDDGTGLIYMRARYYDPVVGRFISEDPALDGVNWYVYCANNPVNLTDRSGNAVEWSYIWWWGIGMALTAVSVISNYTGPTAGLAAIRRAGVATVASMGAILAFGFAASGADCISENSRIFVNVVANMLTWGSALAQIVARSNMISGALARTQAGPAVAAAAAYSTIIAGILVSIGTDIGQ